jgi:protein SCO1
MARTGLSTALLTTALLLAAAPLATATPAVEDVVRLGADNGLALACGATEISARARRLMIDYAPRTTEYGTAFEQATQQAFGAQLKSKAACPAPGELALRVEQHAAALRGTPDAAPQPAQDGAINPRYLMIDTHGAMVSNEDFAGRYQLLTFGYTSCPDVCPTTLANMVQIRKRLGALGERLQLVFITLDPERDDARKLDKYTSYFDTGIVALSGPAELTRAIADHFQVKYRKFSAPGDPAGGYSVDHTAGLYLLGADGAFIARFAYDSAASETAARIAALMQPSAATP